MADTFNTGVQIPNVPAGVNARNADDGYIRIYAREDRVYGRLPDGREIELTNNESGNGDPNDFPVFIQESQPVTSASKYLWVQTNIGGNPDDFTVFFEDGL